MLLNENNFRFSGSKIKSNQNIKFLNYIRAKSMFFTYIAMSHEMTPFTEHFKINFLWCVAKGYHPSVCSVFYSSFWLRYFIFDKKIILINLILSLPFLPFGSSWLFGPACFDVWSSCWLSRLFKRKVNIVMISKGHAW